MTDKDEEEARDRDAARAPDGPEGAKPSEAPSNPLKEWGAAIGLMVALALSFYALISMFKRGLN